MSGLRGGWRRFRRLPAAAQAAAALAVVALYTVAIVAVVTGGDDAASPDAREGGAADARPANDEERAVRAAFAELDVDAPERGDNARLRRPRVQRVRCEDDACRVEFTIGVPGMGVILEQQRAILASVLRETGARRITFDARRLKRLQGAGDPAPEDEETVNGTPLFTLSCDRERARGPLEGRPGGELMKELCTLRTADMGAQHSRSPSRKSAGRGGGGIVEEIPSG